MSFWLRNCSILDANMWSVCDLEHFVCYKRPLCPASDLSMDLFGLIGVREENVIRSKLGVKHADFLR